MSNQTGVVKIVRWMYLVIFVKMIVDKNVMRRMVTGSIVRRRRRRDECKHE